MTTAAVLLIVGLVFAAILFLHFRRVWLRYRVISIMIPSGSDAQAFSYKLTESIRARRFSETPQAGPVRLFHPPAWQKWLAGLQDISVEPAGNGAVLVNGPGFWVLSIGRSFEGAIERPYQGPQPVWPLIRGLLRIIAIGVALLAATVPMFILFGPR